MREGEGGLKAFWTMLKKTALLVEEGFPNMINLALKRPISGSLLKNLRIKAELAVVWGGQTKPNWYDDTDGKDYVEEGQER